ncbi:MAG: hypothetical protein P1U61_00270 [Legionellaceae bacterium]|nr:hypothetical protein [Legionellaceae bacterium]
MADWEKKRKRWVWLSLFCVVMIVIFLVCAQVYLYKRYHTQKNMTVAVQTFTPEEYPDNPAHLSQHYGEYSHPHLVIQENKDKSFNLVFLPGNAKSAKILFKQIDIGLMTPSVPEWVKGNQALTRIALTDRQWNRQQVMFNADNAHIEVIGGDGVEQRDVYQLQLVKNCLNAGLWEILLYSKEEHQKTVLYQGWFTFPLGYYKSIFEKNTELSYWRHAPYLEHWMAPEQLQVDVNKLRKVVQSYPLVLTQDMDEKIAVDTDQVSKRKNIISKSDIKIFKDYMEEDVAFSTFVPPGIYQKNKPWTHEYWRINHPISAVLHVIRSPGSQKPLQEIVITYSDDKPNQNSDSYFYVSGFDLNHLPKRDPTQYAQGQLFLMGIGTPPLQESYDTLLKHPPSKRAVFSVLLNERKEWIDHHEAAIDGVILFIDKHHQHHLHMYLVAYERHAVIAHYVMTLPDDFLHRKRDT